MKVALSVILPAYREADNLRVLLPELEESLRSLLPEGEETEVIVVDAETPMDDTEEVCSANKVRYAPRLGGNSYGAAIRTGISASRGEYVLVMDADCSHRPEFIRPMWEHRLKADVVIASRYVRGGNTDNPWLLVALSRALNLMFKFVVGTPVLDISNSFRLYRGEMLRKIEPTGKDFNVLEEILVKLLWGFAGRPARFMEISYHFRKRKYGDSKRNLFAFGVTFLSTMYRLRRMRREYGGQIVKEKLPGSIRGN